MLREDTSRRHVKARREEIVAVYESANQPMVQIPGRAAQAAQAAVIAMRRGRAFEILVVLAFAQGQENVVYASDAPVPQDELEAAVEEALNFAESMGFILDSNWAGLDPRQKDETMQRMTAFHPPQQKDVEAPVERPKPGWAVTTLTG